VTKERPGRQPLSDPTLAERLDATLGELKALEEKASKRGGQEADVGVLDAC